MALEAGAVRLLTPSLALGIDLAVARALERLALQTEAPPGLVTAAPQLPPREGVAGVHGVVTNCLALTPADLTALPTEARGTQTPGLVEVSGLLEVTNSIAAVAGAEVSLAELATVVRLALTLGSASHQLAPPLVTVNTIAGSRQVRGSRRLQTFCLLTIEKKSLRTETFPGEVVLV